MGDSKNQTTILETSYYFTAAELAQESPNQIPAMYDTGANLVYSSPATLIFNSPGAEGFGVKRAGLSIPGSVMLIVAPGCCGRNTSAIARQKGYGNRFFYLLMDETDLVTGRHLKKIPEAVKEVVDFLDTPPSVVMICITCVDALLGTDMERVCRKAEEFVSMPVKPCYMYALTRDGRKPPMVHVRQSIYSLLPEQKKRSTSVNLLGFFAPLSAECELHSILESIGVKRIREIGALPSYEEFLAMGEANFNLVLHPEARAAASDLAERLQIPYIELSRFYDVNAVTRQYQALEKALGVTFSIADMEDETKEVIAKAQQAYPGLRISVGETLNANPFELALALLQYGFAVPEIFGNPAPEYDYYLQHIAELSPETKVYSNMESTMLYYTPTPGQVDFSIGKDAGYYHPEIPNLPWNEDVQPYGYAGIRQLFTAMIALLSAKGDPS